MVVMSCSGKFHAFNLAEQLSGHGLLGRFYTRYAYQRNTVMRRFVKRIDKEIIPAERIRTAIPLAIADKLNLLNDFPNNDLFDRWVAMQLKRIPADYQTFIGWSCMSLHSLRRAKKDGKCTIIERGSSHIQVQDEILADEYKRFRKSFRIDPRVINKELQEYDEADYISVPSNFVRQTFLQKGICADKLLVNPYGVSTYFEKSTVRVNQKPFTILYLGSLTIRKGLLYLFQALKQLPIPLADYKVWFIGQVDDELKQTIKLYQQPNWTFLGHINHYKLANYLLQASVAVQPSVEEGLSMVIPQMLACGLPVIATTNTGAADLIESGANGYVIPIRDADAIAHHLTYLYEHPVELAQMKTQAALGQTDLSWNAYGERYVNAIQKQVSKVQLL